jgi:hypothetical protein
MRRILLAAVSSFALGAAFCGSASATEGTVTSKITQMLYYEGHGGLLVVVNNMSDLGGCGNSNYFLLSDAQAHYKETVALLLTAQATEKNVSLTIGDCFQGYGRIKHVMLIT